MAQTGLSHDSLGCLFRLCDDALRIREVCVRAGDHAMMSDSTHPTTSQPEAETAIYLFENDPLEVSVREQVREFIER